MKGRYSIVFIVGLLVIFTPHNSAAQFWKRWSKKHKHPATDSAVVKKTVAQAKKKTGIEYPPTQFKTRYRMDLLAPLYLDELVADNKPANNGKVPEKASAGVEFYKGMKLAADTLNKLNYFIDLYVHDVADSFKGIDNLINTGELAHSDLIAGLLQSKDLPQLANYARSKRINFISALSPSDAGISDNPYFTLLQPTLQSHCERIKETLIKHYPKKIIHLFYHNSAGADETAYNYFSKNEEGINFNKVNFDGDFVPGQLKPVLDSVQVNVIVMTFFEIGYAEKVLNRLEQEFPSYQFEVYGMPSWKSMSALHKKESLPNITVNVSEPFYFEHSAKQIRYIERMYRKEFGGKPGELVFRGYETFVWYADLLKKYGSIFNAKMSDNSAAPFTKFQVKPVWDKNLDLLYNENRHVYLYKYHNGVATLE